MFSISSTMADLDPMSVHRKLRLHEYFTRHAEGVEMAEKRANLLFKAKRSKGWLSQRESNDHDWGEGSAKKLAESLGLDYNWFDQALETPESTVEALREHLQLPKGYVSPVPQPATDLNEFVEIAQARVAVSAGHGSVVFEDGQKSKLAFRADYLRAQDIAPEAAVVVRVKGESMEPEICDKSVLLINRAKKRILRGGIYAFRLGEHLFVKYLQEKQGELTAISANPDKSRYPDISISARSDDFEMIGQAVWMARKL